MVIADGTAYATAGMFPSEGFIFWLWMRSPEPSAGARFRRTSPAQGYLLASATRLYIPAGRDNPVVCDRATGKRIRWSMETAEPTHYWQAAIPWFSGLEKRGNSTRSRMDRRTNSPRFRKPNDCCGDRSYLHSDTELSALDRGRYLQLARDRKSISRQQGKSKRPSGSWMRSRGAIPRRPN